MNEAEQLRRRIEVKAGVKVGGLRFFAAGNNTTLFLVDLKEGQRLVAKVGGPGGNQNLDTEAWMLEYLAANSRLPVPEVIWAESDLLVMNYVASSGVIDGQAEIVAAELLASLHAIKAPQYGLERDTLIGPLDQPNGFSDDWLEFFRDRRLLYMAKAAYAEQRIDGKLLAMIEKLAGKLDLYIGSSARPSLLHGDVWSGNVMAVPGKITGFIDPAIYYGDPEIELAFATMFGTFGKNFFSAYNEISPVRDGFFEVRKDIYNLYPLLVHARLFGRAYAESVQKTVHRLAA